MLEEPRFLLGAAVQPDSLQQVISKRERQQATAKPLPKPYPLNPAAASMLIAQAAVLANG